MPRGRSLLAASAVAPAPPQGSDAASASVSHSIEPVASSDACVTDAATTPQISTPTDGAAHPSEVPEGQIVANSGHQITPVGRLMLGDAASDATVVTAERVAVRHADGSDPTAAPSAEPPDACTAMQHKERLVAMFLTAEEGPVASHVDAVAEQATLEYVIGMDENVRDFWSHHADEVIRRCAPSMPKGLLDQQEVFGFALADGVGRPLLPHDAARGVGSAGDDALKSAKGTRKKPGPLTRAKEAAREAVRKETRAAEKDAALWERVAAVGKAGQSAVAAVLRKPVNLKLPNATVGALVGAKRKRPTAAAAEGADPIDEELVAGLKQARAVFDNAKALAAATECDCERAERRLETQEERQQVIKASIVYPPKEAFDTEDQWVVRCCELEERAGFDESATDRAVRAWMAAEGTRMDSRLAVVRAELSVRQSELLCNTRLLALKQELWEYEEHVREEEEFDSCMESVLARCAAVQRGEELDEQVWDAATAVQAQEEMCRASRERCMRSALL